MTKLIMSQIAESFVFVNEEQQPLHFQSAVPGSMQLRSHSEAGHSGAINFAEGIDYEVDYVRGLIARTKGSRIPNWSEHALYGVPDFDHTLYENYSNSSYTVYADYAYDWNGNEEAPAESTRGDSDVLLSVKQKLARGQEVAYVVYGDSISAGGEASKDENAFYSRFADRLTDLYPKGSIRIINKSIGGETSDGGAARVSQEVISESPDLVTIGYGMNDQNKYEFGQGVSLAGYESNIRQIIEKIRDSSNAAVVLVTPCQPNPLWKHTSGKIGEYAEVLRRLAQEYGIGVADAYAVWQDALNAGKSPESLLLNNINHPNDYGHWLYSKAFEPVISGFDQ